MALGRSSIVLPFLALALAGCGSDASTGAPAATDQVPAVAEPTAPGADVATTTAAATADPPSSEPGIDQPVPSDATVVSDTSVPGPPSTLDGERADADATEDDNLQVNQERSEMEHFCSTFRDTPLESPYPVIGSEGVMIGGQLS